MKIKQKPSIVVFEIIDDEKTKKWETKAGAKYNELIVDFLNSIGFDVTYKYPESKTTILIDGIEMNFDFDSASYAGRSSFTKKCEPRKNRQVKIQESMWSHIRGVIVPINKEIDKEKLIKKLTKLVNEKKQVIYNRVCKEQAEIDLGLKLVKHIKSNPVLKVVATSLNINKTCFSVNTDCGFITFNLDTWSFNTFSPKEIPFITIDNIFSAPMAVRVMCDNALKYIGELTKLGNCLSPEEIALTKEMNHNPEF